MCESRQCEIHEFAHRYKSAFLWGLARIIDIGATLEPLFLRHGIFEVDDDEAIANDWKTIGNDIRLAMSKFIEEVSSNNERME